MDVEWSLISCHLVKSMKDESVKKSLCIVIACCIVSTCPSLC